MTDYQLSAEILNRGEDCFPTTASPSQACQEYCEHRFYFDINDNAQMMDVILSGEIELDHTALNVKRDAAIKYLTKRAANDS